MNPQPPVEDVDDVAARIADEVTTDNRIRWRCVCADWPKPCSYHDGYWDGAAAAARRALDPGPDTGA